MEKTIKIEEKFLLNYKKRLNKFNLLFQDPCTSLQVLAVNAFIDKLLKLDK